MKRPAREDPEIADFGGLEAVERGLKDGLVRRDPNALLRLYDLYGAGLYRFALSRLGNAEDAADVLQETLLAAAESAPAYRGESSLRTWLFGICRHKVQDRFRARNREVGVGRMEREGGVERRAPYDEPRLRSDGREPPGAPGQVADSLVFWESFGRLSPEQQDVILLACYYGFNQREIARIVGVPVGTVKSRVYYGRRRLAKLLGLGSRDGEGKEEAENARAR